MNQRTKLETNPRKRASIGDARMNEAKLDRVSNVSRKPGAVAKSLPRNGSRGREEGKKRLNLTLSNNQRVGNGFLMKKLISLPLQIKQKERRSREMEGCRFAHLAGKNFDQKLIMTVDGGANVRVMLS